MLISNLTYKNTGIITAKLPEVKRLQATVTANKNKEARIYPQKDIFCNNTFFKGNVQKIEQDSYDIKKEACKHLEEAQDILCNAADLEHNTIFNLNQISLNKFYNAMAYIEKDKNEGYKDIIDTKGKTVRNYSVYESKNGIVPKTIFEFKDGRIYRLTLLESSIPRTIREYIGNKIDIYNYTKEGTLESFTKGYREIPYGTISFDERIETDTDTKRIKNYYKNCKLTNRAIEAEEEINFKDGCISSYKQSKKLERGGQESYSAVYNYDMNRNLTSFEKDLIYNEESKKSSEQFIYKNNKLFDYKRGF